MVGPCILPGRKRNDVRSAGADVRWRPVGILRLLGMAPVSRAPRPCPESRSTACPTNFLPKLFIDKKIRTLHKKNQNSVHDFIPSPTWHTRPLAHWSFPVCAGRSRLSEMLDVLVLLDAACAGNAALLPDVDLYVAAHAALRSHLAEPKLPAGPDSAPAPNPSPPSAEAPPCQEADALPPGTDGRGGRRPLRSEGMASTADSPSAAPRAALEEIDSSPAGAEPQELEELDSPPADADPQEQEELDSPPADADPQELHHVGALHVALATPWAALRGLSSRLQERPGSAKGIACLIGYLHAALVEKVRRCANRFSQSSQSICCLNVWAFSRAST
jgi:hypothetical protein